MSKITNDGLTRHYSKDSFTYLLTYYICFWPY